MPIPKNNELNAWILSPQEERSSMKPIHTLQPKGTSFEITDINLIEWEGFNFRIGFTAREGITLHTMTYKDRLSTQTTGGIDSTDVNQDSTTSNSVGGGGNSTGSGAAAEEEEEESDMGVIRKHMINEEDFIVRPIAYRMSVAEMVVPYGDPNHPHYLKVMMKSKREIYYIACILYTSTLYISTYTFTLSLSL